MVRAFCVSLYTYPFFQHSFDSCLGINGLSGTAHPPVTLERLQRSVFPTFLTLLYYAFAFSSLHPSLEFKQTMVFTEKIFLLPDQTGLLAENFWTNLCEASLRIPSFKKLHSTGRTSIFFADVRLKTITSPVPRRPSWGLVSSFPASKKSRECGHN